MPDLRHVLILKSRELFPGFVFRQASLTLLRYFPPVS